MPKPITQPEPSYPDRKTFAARLAALGFVGAATLSLGCGARPLGGKPMPPSQEAPCAQPQQQPEPDEIERPLAGDVSIPDERG